jgi:transketolase
MMNYGGTEAFMKLYNECRTDVETVENGIKANSERITSLKIFRDDIATYHRTKPIFKQYEQTNFLFKERFRRKNESEIMKHENAASALQYYSRPLRKLKDINAEITRIEAANTTNNKTLTKRKSDLKQLGYIHTYLHRLKREHEPPPPPREQTRTRKRSNDIDL